MFRCLTLESVSETPKPKPWVQDQTKFTAKGDVDCSRSHLGCDCFQKVWPNGSAARWATCDNTSARIGCLLWNPTRLFSPGTRTSTISISPTQYKYPCPFTWYERCRLTQTDTRVILITSQPHGSEIVAAVPLCRCKRRFCSVWSPMPLQTPPCGSVTGQ